MRKIIGEFRRRRIFRVLALYVLASWMVAQIGDILFPALALPEWSMSMTVALLVLGFPVAMGLAWAFDVEPDGISRTGEVGESRALAFPLFVLLLLAATLGLAAALYWGILDDNSSIDRTERTDTAGTRAPPSIAVLAFDNMSGNPANDYFSEGLSETILHRLAQLEGIRVAARTSSFAFKGTDRDIREIAHDLNVDTILEGSVQESGDRLRIHAQLIDGNNGTHLWSESYDRPASGIFDIHDEIAEHTVQLLKVSLLGDEKNRLVRHATNNVDAHKAYLRGRQFAESRATEYFRPAQDAFARAIELDPEYALAYVGLAESLIIGHSYTGSDPGTALRRAKEALGRALDLDPESADATRALGVVLAAENRVDEAIDMLRRAIELNPNDAKAMHQLSYNLREFNGPGEEALMWRLRAADRDPLSPIIRVHVAVELESMGRCDGARLEYERLLADQPDFAVGHQLFGEALWASYGDRLGAARSILGAIDLDAARPYFHSLLSVLYLDLGMIDEAVASLDRSVEIASADATAVISSLLLKRSRGQNVSRADIRAIPSSSALQWGRARFARLYRDSAIEQEQLADAIALYADWFPELSAADGIQRSNSEAAVDYAYLLQLDGRMDEADRLLDAALDILRGTTRLSWLGAGVSDAEIYALQGRPDRALEALERARADGWQYLWWWELNRNPNFASLHDMPRWVTIVDGFQREADEDAAVLRAN